MPSISLGSLPNEVIQQILLYVPAPSLAAFRCLSRRLRDLVEPFVWRHHCNTEFRYWSPKHHIKEKFSGAVGAADWENVFMQRYKADVAISKLLDGILASQVNRVEKFDRIVEYGYDAKDTLLRHLTVDDDAEDVLARRHYSDAVLALLHRTAAVEQWSNLQKGKEVALDTALASFDMFVLRDREGDFDEISYQLDVIADKIRKAHPDLQAQTPRQRAVIIVTYLRANHLLGLKDISHYHNLQNCFLGIALHGDEHPSMPLISTAIFCCIARRLGLDAHACSFPFHVIAVIKPTAGFDMGGHPSPLDDIPPAPMYMDPFRSDRETATEQLTAQLRAMGAPDSSHAKTLEAASTTEIVLRTARNILTSVQDRHRINLMRRDNGIPDDFDSACWSPDPELAYYGALWASVLVGTPSYVDRPGVAAARRSTFLPSFVEHFETHFPTDVSLIEHYVVPLFQTFGEHLPLLETIRVMRCSDSVPKQVKPRTREIAEHVRYKIGQVFRHKRYGYHGIIMGWDVECGADEQWMVAMRVDELARGRHQSFYHVLVEDKSVRYVAEDNVEIQTPDFPRRLMSLAGRHFKRWDRSTHSFVSNIKDEYPDD